MRITNLYDLREKKEVRKQVKESLFLDVFRLANHQFDKNEFKGFMIKIKLVPIEKDGGYI